MDEVRSWLYIGKYRDTLDEDLLAAMSIQAVLQLAEPISYPTINSLYISVDDVKPTPHSLIAQGVSFILDEKQKKHKVLVACGAGINRSTTFCIAALKEVEGISLVDAYKDIRRKHPSALPNKAVWESFCAYYEESTPYLDIMRLSIQTI